MKRLRKVVCRLLCAVMVAGACACSGEKSASGQKVADIKTQQEKPAVNAGKYREKPVAAEDAATEEVVVENNSLSLPGGMMNYGQAVASWNQYAEANGLTPEQKQAGLDKLAKGDLPEGANITKVIVDGYKDGVLMAGAGYLGPAASVGKAVGGAVIAEIANGSYQWFDLNKPGNENKGWDYKGSVSAGITGALAPGREVWQNAGIAAGGAIFMDGPDAGAVGGAVAGAWAGGKFGELAPFPGEVNDLFGGIGGEIISNNIKDKVNGN